MCLHMPVMFYCVLCSKSQEMLGSCANDLVCDIKCHVKCTSCKICAKFVCVSMLCVCVCVKGSFSPSIIPGGSVRWQLCARRL